MNVRSHASAPIGTSIVGCDPSRPAAFPDFAIGLGARPAPDVSPDLAHLITIAGQRKRIFERASRAADLGPSIDPELRHTERTADAAHMAAIQSVIHEPAKSMTDILAKFTVVRDTAELEDIAHQLERPGSTQTERMLWSICSDLLELSRKAPQTAI